MRADTIFAQIKECDEANIANIGEEHDAEMGEKSRQPFGLPPKRPLTLSRALLIFAISASARFALSTVLAGNARAPHYV